MNTFKLAEVKGVYFFWHIVRGEQVYSMCMMEELIPSIGTPVPSPSVLAVAISLSESTLQNVSKHCSNGSYTSPEVDFDNPFDFYDVSHIISKTHIISISDDGKIWNWLLTAEGIGEGAPKDEIKLKSNSEKVSTQETNATDPGMNSIKQIEDITITSKRLSNPTTSGEEMLFKVG